MKPIILCVSLICFGSLEAAYIFKNGSFTNAKFLAVSSAEDHFNLGLTALKQKNWEEASLQLQTVITSFPSSAYAKEATYFLGVTYYERADFELANTMMTTYLQYNRHTTHVENIYRYKLAIAQKFAHGYRRHLFGIESLPCLSSGHDLALTIFEEIIAATPSQELSAVAFQEKASLLYRQENFSEALETYTTILRQFPNSHYALQAYLSISHCYVHQLYIDPHNVDALTMAEINRKEFLKTFSQAPQATIIEQEWLTIQTTHAQALFETALLYERKGSRTAAVMYYTYIESTYTHLPIAKQCSIKLKELSCAPSA